MVRKKPTAFMLKRGDLRQSWNKYNLYNLSRAKNLSVLKLNYFKQKWQAKSRARKYHGEQVIESHWKRLFSPTMRAVVPMDPRYLAQSNGSVESAGRGSGFDEDPYMDPVQAEKQASKKPRPTPYMNMAFAPLERRLDSAVHRALFASSIRQARQFCVHGAVKVNGKKMPYPGYLLNPGDMFQVEPDRVLYATGARKGAEERRETRIHKKSRKPKSDEEETKSEPSTKSTVEVDGPIPEEDAKKTLQNIMGKAKEILAVEKDTASASRKRDLRALNRMLRSTISRNAQGRTMAASTEDEMNALMTKLGIQEVADEEPEAEQAGNAAAEQTQPERSLTKAQKRELEQVLEELRDNPIDPSKPYATPWRPRDYMSAFAFIPRYLEVHHKVCSAVYLRHPVARPGLAEVPSPFPEEVNGLAFNWYLRRR